MILFLVFRCSSTYVRSRLFLSLDAAHPRRGTKTKASSRTKQGGRFEMPDEKEATCKHFEKGQGPFVLLTIETSLLLVSETFLMVS